MVDVYKNGAVWTPSEKWYLVQGKISPDANPELAYPRLDKNNNPLHPHHSNNPQKANGNTYVRMSGGPVFSQKMQNNLNSLNVSTNESSYQLMQGSQGGAYALPTVTDLEPKEIILADEIFQETGQRCIFPQDRLPGIEGFLEDGTPITMKEVESGDLTTIIPNINDMYTKIAGPGLPWQNVEGYLKIPFDTFVKTKKGVQSTVTVTPTEIQNYFNTAISRNRNNVKLIMDGTVSNITVFVKGLPPFPLDLSGL